MTGTVSMTGTVFAKGMRDLRRGLLGWGIGFAVLVMLMSALWPSIRDMPDLDEFLANYPEAMRSLFDIESIATGAGYLNAELFTIIVPAMFLIFCISRGARLLAGDEETGRLEVVLATPIPRWHILLGKTAALTVSAAILAGVLFFATSLTSAIFDMDVTPGNLASACAIMLMLSLAYGLLAMAVGATTGKRGLALGVAGVLAVGGYVLYVAGKLVDAIEPWSVVSPFTQALDDGPLGGRVTLGLVWVFLCTVGLLAVSVALFERRDLASA